MEHSGISRQTIEPYYKQGNVFERDEAYYSQMLSGSRRIPHRLMGSRQQGSRSRSRNVERNQGYSHSRINQANINLVNTRTIVNQQEVAHRQQSAYVSEQTQIMQENNRLKAQIDHILNSSDSFGNTSNVVMLRHYAEGGAGSAKLREQQTEIKRLQEIMRGNESRIKKYQQSAEELRERMNNIQALDKEIYRTLQGSVNRDKELLDRASSALARGETRQDIAKILEQIIA